jgi:hypothetical protein
VVFYGYKDQPGLINDGRVFLEDELIFDRIKTFSVEPGNSSAKIYILRNVGLEGT